MTPPYIPARASLPWAEREMTQNGGVRRYSVIAIMETLFVMDGNKVSELSCRVNGNELLKQGKLLSPSASSGWRSKVTLCIDGCNKLLVTQ